MATEKRLIDANELVDTIYRSDEKLHSTQWETDEIVDQIDRIPTVDAVEVSRLGKLGQMMMPYPGCPRGMIGQRGEVGGGKDQSLEILELDPITDIDGNRWVPVLDSDLAALKDKAKGAVKVVRCKDCRLKNEPGQPNILCYHMKDDDFCSYGEREDNE